MPAGMQILDVVRIQQIVQLLQDIRLNPQELYFLSHTPLVDAVDGEIMARYNFRIQIADIVADDQSAAVYTSGKLTFESMTIPNLKHGVAMTQEMLNQLQQLSSGRGIPGDTIFTNYQTRTIDDLLTGVKQRMEALLVACKLDAFSYDRLGIKISGVGWGMPSDLKVTPSVTWDTPATATPVDDVLNTKLRGATRYGTNYDRMVLSTTAFRHMIATDQWRNRAAFYLPPSIPASQIPLQDLNVAKNYATNILGLREIVLYDGRYWSQAEDGVITSTPFLPINAVILEEMAGDNNPNAVDFANGIVTESIVGSVLPTSTIGRFAGPTRGPVAYATGAPDLNPPNIQYWAVARGFPRKHRLQSNAVLTVGSFSDLIPTSDPF